VLILYSVWLSSIKISSRDHINRLTERGDIAIPSWRPLSVDIQNATDFNCSKVESRQLLLIVIHLATSLKCI